MPKIVERSWGKWFEIFRTKNICIKFLNFIPLKHISMQRHEHRTELWFVLKGGGLMILNDMHGKGIFSFTKIPPNQWHQFHASEKGAIVLEIQYGKDVKENDIERI